LKNKIEDLRNHLFATLEALADKDDPMDLERAKTIAIVAQQVIQTARVEVDFLEATGGTGTGFIPIQAIHDRDNELDPPRLRAVGAKT
jgi:hypothetical protein